MYKKIVSGNTFEILDYHTSILKSLTIIESYGVKVIGIPQNIEGGWGITILQATREMLNSINIIDLSTKDQWRAFADLLGQMAETIQQFVDKEILCYPNLKEFTAKLNIIFGTDIPEELSGNSQNCLNISLNDKRLLDFLLSTTLRRLRTEAYSALHKLK